VPGSIAVRYDRTRVRFLLRARRDHSSRAIVVGAAMRENVHADRLPFTIALSRRAQLALRRLGRLQVTLVVTCTAPGRPPVTATHTVPLRRA